VLPTDPGVFVRNIERAMRWRRFGVVLLGLAGVLALIGWFGPALLG
jgi:hypothetical protein